MSYILSDLIISHFIVYFFHSTGFLFGELRSRGAVGGQVSGPTPSRIRTGVNAHRVPCKHEDACKMQVRCKIRSRYMRDRCKIHAFPRFASGAAAFSTVCLHSPSSWSEPGYGAERREARSGGPWRAERGRRMQIANRGECWQRSAAKRGNALHTQQTVWVSTFCQAALPRFANEEIT